MATDKDQARRAAEEADKGRPDPSIVDLAPKGSLVVPAAAMRLLQRVQTVEPDLDDYEGSCFALFVAVKSMEGKKARANVWKLGRTPKALYDAFCEWQWETPADQMTQWMEQITPELDEYGRNAGMLDGGEDDGGGPGDEGNASG